MTAKAFMRRALPISALGLPLLCLTVLVLMAVRTSVRLTTPPGYSHPGHTQRTPGVVESAAGPAWTFADDPQQRYGLPFQEVIFPTGDGSMLRGWLIPGQGTPTSGIVAAHARGGDRRGYLDQAPTFHQLGLTTLLFDYREHGLSDGAGRGMSLGFREAEDIVAAVRFLKDVQGLERVATIGFSLGGSSVILAAAQDPSIDAVIAENSIASFDGYVEDMTEQWLHARGLPGGLPLWQGWWPRLVVEFTAWRVGVRNLQAPVDIVGRIAPRPILLIHGTEDTVVKPAHSERLYARAGEPRHLLFVAGVDHSSRYSDFPVEYRERVIAFLEQALK